MQFNSTIFIFFFLPVVILIHTLLRKNNVRNVWLLLTSFLFYGWCNTRGLLFLVIYGLINYCIAWIASTHPKKKLWMICGVCIDVAVLFVFKYFNFSASTVNQLLGTSLPMIDLFMPMGISFVTFTAIAYLVDVYKGQAVAPASVLDFLLYLSFFPKAAQGPITRYGQMDQSLESRRCSFPMFMEGFKRFIIGLAKKCLIADVLGKCVDQIFSNLQIGISCETAWIGILFYTFQIFYDFSGYTDMAIGIGKMLGFTLPENFDTPYLSKSVSEFWRRWHITLGLWFRNYIYIPLGGNRKGTLRTVINLAVVWLVTGIWHGASFNYILWGIYYGILVITEKLVSKQKWYTSIPQILKWAMTFFIVIIGWVMFRSATLEQMTLYFKTMFGMSDTRNYIYGLGYYIDIPSLIAFVCAIILALPRPKSLVNLSQRSNIAYCLYNICLLVLFFAAVIFMVNSTYSSFIYFQF